MYIVSEDLTIDRRSPGLSYPSRSGAGDVLVEKSWFLFSKKSQTLMFKETHRKEYGTFFFCRLYESFSSIH